MNNQNETTILLKALDLELKALLEKDLEQFKTKKSRAGIQIAA